MKTKMPKPMRVKDVIRHLSQMPMNYLVVTDMSGFGPAFIREVRKHPKYKYVITE